MCNPYPVNTLLLVAAALNFVAVMIHVAIIVGGPDLYRRFGAGERFARAAAAGSWIPPLTTLFIALMLMLWSLYALSGAGIDIGISLPFVKHAILIIAGIYALRGLVIVALLTTHRQHATRFLLSSSVICIGYAMVHFIGLWQVWHCL